MQFDGMTSDCSNILLANSNERQLKNEGLPEKKWTLSESMGAPSLVQLNSGMGLPLTGVVILNFWPSSTATSPMGRAKLGGKIRSVLVKSSLQRRIYNQTGDWTIIRQVLNIDHFWDQCLNMKEDIIIKLKQGASGPLKRHFGPLGSRKAACGWQEWALNLSA